MGDLYKPTGQLQGVTDSFPDRGTSTGFADNQQTDGCSLDMDSTNSLGGISRFTKSDPPGEENINDGDAGESDSEYA